MATFRALSCSELSSASRCCWPCRAAVQIQHQSFPATLCRNLAPDPQASSLAAAHVAPFLCTSSSPATQHHGIFTAVRRTAVLAAALGKRGRAGSTHSSPPPRPGPSGPGKPPRSRPPPAGDERSGAGDRNANGGAPGDANKGHRQHRQEQQRGSLVHEKERRPKPGRRQTLAPEAGPAAQPPQPPSSTPKPATSRTSYHGDSTAGVTASTRQPVPASKPPSSPYPQPQEWPHPQPQQQQQQPQRQRHPLLVALLRLVRPLDEAGYAYCAVRRTAAWLQGVPLPPRPDTPSSSPPPPSPPPSTEAAALSVPSPSQFAPVVLLDSACAGEAARQRGPSPPRVETAEGSSPDPGPALEPVSVSASPDAAADLEVEVQWDQFKTVHELFSREGSGWAVSPVRQLPGGTASFTMVWGRDTAAATTFAAAAGPTATATATTGVFSRATEAAATASTPDRVADRGSQPSYGTGAEAPSGTNVVDVAKALAAPGGAVIALITCAYNTVLRANPARVLITPRPPVPPHEAEREAEGEARTVAAAPGGRGAGHSDRGQGRSQASVGPGSGDGEGLPGGSLLRVLTQKARVAGPDGNGRPTPQVWAQSLYSVGVEAERSGDRALADAVRETLARMQRELSAHNTAAWGRDTAYDAWVARFGTPAEAAARLLRDPGRCLGPLLPYLQMHDSPPLRGLAVANLLGSHGHKAVALAALGARVTLLDASAGNAAYAEELAAAAGVGGAVSYVIGDLAALGPTLAATAAAAAPGPAETLEGSSKAAAVPPASPTSLAAGSFDLVLMEMGVLHYFLDLRAIMRDVVSPLLRPGGRLLLREFHPVSTKLVTSKGKKHKVTGDYFISQPLEAVDVAYSKYEEAAAAAASSSSSASLSSGGSSLSAPDSLSADTFSAAAGGPGGSRPRVLLRRWGLGEVVSAVAGRDGGGLRVVVVDEEPGARLDDAGLPKVFTLLAEKSG